MTPLDLVLSWKPKPWFLVSEKPAIIGCAPPRTASKEWVHMFRELDHLPKPKGFVSRFIKNYTLGSNFSRIYSETEKKTKPKKEKRLSILLNTFQHQKGTSCLFQQLQLDSLLYGTLLLEYLPFGIRFFEKIILMVTRFSKIIKLRDM